MRLVASTDPQLIVLAVSLTLSLTAVLASVFTWYASRAKKIRSAEDQILGIVRAYQLRVGQMETQLAEWKAVIEGILEEVQEFFERTTRERKRIQTTQRRAEEQVNQNDTPVDLSLLPRDQAMAAVRAAFTGR